MAEVVQYRVERTLDELKVLIDFGIFNQEHAKEILKKREVFEYNLRRRTNTKLDYLKYIKFETNMLESIETYRNTIVKEVERIENEIDQKIFRLRAKKLSEIIRVRSAHVSVLYRKLVTKYQFDKRLWIAYIEFAKQRNWNTRVSALYWRLLRVSSKDETLWVAAAKHEVDHRQDQNTARKLYLMGLRHHPKSLELLSRLEEICDSETIRKYKEQVQSEREEQEAEGTARDQPSISAPSSQTEAEKLQDCHQSKGIVETRRLYRDLERSVKHQQLPLYVSMIQVESSHLAEDKSEEQLNRVREIYDKALSKYGAQEVDLWCQYLQFEHQHIKNLEDLERIHQIHRGALANLAPCKVDQFIEYYTLLVSNG